MRITINSKRFYNCLETVEKALPLRTTVPLINYIYFEVNANELVFSSTNLEMALKVKMDYQSSETGKILLPSKIIDIMRYFPTEEVKFDINWENHRIDISGGSAHFNLLGADPQDYPVTSFNEVDEDDSYIIDQKKLKSMLKSVIFAASSEETRPAFNGILFSFKDDQLTLTASDTYRLAIKKENDEKWAFEEKQCLVPARVMRDLLRLLDGHEEKVFFKVDNNSIAFRFDNNHFISRLLEEKYPDVSGVIPTTYKTRAVIDRKGFENIINRATLLAEGKNQAVNLILKDSQLEARVISQQGRMDESISVDQDGESIDLYVNTRFVIDILKATEEQNIIMDFHGDGGPIIFRNVDNKNYLYLVLPIKKVN